MNNVRWILALAALTILLLICALTGEAHNVSVAFPNEVVVDIGDMARWLTLNPDANVPNPETYIAIAAKNLGTISVKLCAVPVKQGTLSTVSCPSTPISLASGGSGRYVCTVDVNAFAGYPLKKTFTGPEYVDPVELNILVIDSGATDCSTYTTLYNWYVEDLNIVIADTNDTNWVKIYDWNGDVSIEYAGTIATSSFDDSGQRCIDITGASWAARSGVADATCRSGNCYFVSTYYDEFYKFPNISTLGYNECIFVSYVRPALNDRVGIYIQNPKTDSCVGTTTSLTDTKAYPYFNDSWAQMAAHIPANSTDINAIIWFMYYSTTSYTRYVDDVRVYCR